MAGCPPAIAGCTHRGASLGSVHPETRKRGTLLSVKTQIPPLTVVAGFLLGAALGVMPVGSRAAASDAALETIAENSGFVRTGRYDEVEKLCDAYAHRWTDSVKCREFGRTPEGRPMLALIASRSGALSAKEARERRLPVLLLQGGIHAGEIDGKDAGFIALRELLASASALKNFVLVFVPVFNVDGHERFARGNRPNQIGPEEMGSRASAQNLNLNRDYMKADAPEMQAMLRLLNAWDPVLYVDMHVTDGANFQYDVSNTIEPLHASDASLNATAAQLLEQLNSRIAARGVKPLDFYPELLKEDDPASGFARNVYSPRFSTGYWALHNRLGLLVETHSWKDYARRVQVTHDIIVTLVEMMSHDGARWRTQALADDAHAQQLGGQTIALDFTNGPQVTMIDFLGYAYAREPSAVSGTLATRYDPTKPEIWHVPLADSIVAKESAQAPRGGYIVTAAHSAWVAEKLRLHGIRFEKITQGKDSAAVEAFRATKVTYSKETFEGHTMLTFDGEWKAQVRSIPAGSLFVPIAQPNARLVVALLEPRGVDSLAAWGFFATAFEAKEYMEPYVAEQVGADMLAHDPAIAADFNRRLDEDPQFAASPRARLDYFYQHSGSWDERLGLYPVFRIESAGVGGTP